MSSFCYPVGGSEAQVIYLFNYFLFSLDWTAGASGIYGLCLLDHEKCSIFFNGVSISFSTQSPWFWCTTLVDWKWYIIGFLCFQRQLETSSRVALSELTQLPLSGCTTMGDR